MYEWDVETRIAVLPPGGEELISYEYSDGVVYQAEGVTVTAFPVVHAPPDNSFGFRVEFNNRVFVFSGDTKRCQSLIDNAQDVDLLVHESFPPAELYAEKAGRPIELARVIAEELHTSPREVGTIFRDTNPRLGVIYHMYNNDDLIIAAADQVRETYGGRFIVGQDLTVINIGAEVIVRPAIVGDKAWPVRVQ